MGFVSYQEKKKIESGSILVWPYEYFSEQLHLYAYTGFNPVFKVSSHNVT